MGTKGSFPFWQIVSFLFKVLEWTLTEINWNQFCSPDIYIAFCCSDTSVVLSSQSELNRLQAPQGRQTSFFFSWDESFHPDEQKRSAKKIMNNYSSKSLLATFQSSFRDNTKHWACGASLERKLLQPLQVTLDSLTLLSLFFLQLEPDRRSQQVLLSAFPHNSSSMKSEIFELVALSGLTHLLKRLEGSRSEMRITLTYVL